MTPDQIKEKAQEALRKRLYSLAKQKGLKMELNRKWERGQPENYRIRDRVSGEVVHAARPGGYGLTLEQAEEYLKRQPVTLGGKAQAAEPIIGVKGVPAFMKPAQPTTPTPPAAADQDAMLHPKAESLVRIADAAIPLHIKVIFNLLTLWTSERALVRPNTRPTPEELELVAPDHDAWMSLGKCERHEMVLYMFARLLGTVEETR